MSAREAGLPIVNIMQFVIGICLGVNQNKYLKNILLMDLIYDLRFICWNTCAGNLFPNILTRPRSESSLFTPPPGLSFHPECSFTCSLVAPCRYKKDTATYIYIYIYIYIYMKDWGAKPVQGNVSKSKYSRKCVKIYIWYRIKRIKKMCQKPISQHPD